jgi:TetR/AcrR family transcriptional regulator, ethionamide resistance regulator
MSPQAQRTRHREQRESTRHRILAAGERFLRENPYRELSVDVVMAETGLTRTAFYRHFDDVTELVLRLFAEVNDELYTVGERWARSAGVGYPAPGRAGLAGTVDVYVRHGPLLRAVAEAAVTDERIEEAYRGSTEAFIELTAAALERMVSAGKLDVPDAHALARAMTLMNQAYLLAEFGREPQGDPKLALATLESVWLRLAVPLPR